MVARGKPFTIEVGRLHQKRYILKSFLQDFFLLNGKIPSSTERWTMDFVCCRGIHGWNCSAQALHGLVFLLFLLCLPFCFEVPNSAGWISCSRCVILWPWARYFLKIWQRSCHQTVFRRPNLRLVFFFLVDRFLGRTANLSNLSWKWWSRSAWIGHFAGVGADLHRRMPMWFLSEVCDSTALVVTCVMPLQEIRPW